MNNIFTTIDFHGTTLYEVCMQRPGAFFVRHLAYLPDTPPTLQELADAEAETAMYESYESYLEKNGWVDEYPAPLYSTEAAAQRATELHAAMNFAVDDCDLWGAPSECWADACRPLERELEALEEAFGVAPKQNPYAERGVDDWSRPVRDSLPPGMTDDRDILQALGERSAASH